MNPIPVNRPLLDGRELQYLTDCIESGWVSSEGPYVEKLEADFSIAVQRPYGVAVSSGSAALDLAVQALDLQAGDEVIMPAFTIISPAFSVIRAGLKPVLVDADPLTWNMDAGAVEAKITSRTKAIILVHIYGLPVDLYPLLALANRYGLKVIEDAAEMHGQTYCGKPCGSFGDLSVFSFYPNKLITTGEGGLITTDDETLAARCRKLRNLAFEPGARRFVHHEMGWNYRLTNLQAALGCAQLENMPRNLQRKQAIGQSYQQGLSGLRGFQQPLASTPYAKNIYWVYGLVAETAALAKQAVEHLQRHGIATRPFFWSMHQQPVFQKMGFFKNERYPVAEWLSQNGFYIPSGVGLTEEEQERVIETLLNFHG